MLKFGKFVVKARWYLLVLGILLLIPSAIGYIRTRINYDVLAYLPSQIDTMKGQDILKEEFGTGAYSMFICEGMSDKDAAALKKKLEEVDHVEKIVWYDTLSDISVPMKDMLPGR